MSHLAPPSRHYFEKYQFLHALGCEGREMEALPKKIANIILTNGALFRVVYSPYYQAQATLTLKLVNTM